MSKITAQPKYQVVVVPHTHWDREWYRPFQEFRYRLIQVVDSVLDLLDRDPRYKCFTLDGQTIVLEDYLEICPEREADIRRQVQAGRLLIGPWYVLADEFLISAEATVRNLLRGHRIAKRFGEPMAVGYVPDPFGHTSQLPLILSGFGINSAIFQRGVGDEGEELHTEFLWQAADGTVVLAIHLMASYSAFASTGHRDWEGRDPVDLKLTLDWARMLLEGVEPEDSSGVPQWLLVPLRRNLPQGLAGRASCPVLLLPSGSDHLFPQPELPDIISHINQQAPHLNLRHGSFPEYLRRLRQARPRLKTFQGEFRSGRYQDILTGVLSARLYLKQANERCQTLLERHAEPLATLAQVFAGKPYPRGFLNQAWKYLMQSHPHDSICGCSVDQVHQEMMPRFDQVRQIGNLVAREGLKGLAEQVDTSALQSGRPLVVMNTLGWARDAVVSYTLEVPANAPTPPMVVRSRSGQAVPTQGSWQLVDSGNGPARQVLELAFLAQGLPACGYETYVLAEGEPSAPSQLRAGKRWLENEHLRVEVAKDGTLTLRDKASGASYRQLLLFEDVADGGDEYDFGPLPNDVPITSLGTEAEVSLVRSGPVQATLLVCHKLRLPESLAASRRRRSRRLVECPIEVCLSLGAGSRRLNIEVRLSNRAKDHRLRAVFPTAINADHVYADGHFDVLKRSLQLPSGEGWYQLPSPTGNQQAYVAVTNGQQGLAVINQGLPEYEADNARRHGNAGVTIGVTLLRCVGYLSRGDLSTRNQYAGPSTATPDAQCLGEHTYRLALYPFVGEHDDAQLHQPAHEHNVPVLAAETTRHSGTLPATASLVEIDAPHLVLSTLKGAEDREALILRLYNPTMQEQQGRIRLLRLPRTVVEVNLNEQPIGPATVDTAGYISLTMRPKGVRTLMLSWSSV